MNTPLFAQVATEVAVQAQDKASWLKLAWDFMTSPAGLTAIALFFAYLFLWKFLGWTLGVLRIGLGRLANVYLFSLLILVAGVVAYSVGDSWKNNTDPWVNAMKFGGAASACWAVAFLVIHRFRSSTADDDESEPKPKKK